MTDRTNDRLTRDSREKDPQDAPKTSGNREESMNDSGKDAFGKKSPQPDRGAATQADGTKRDDELDPASSGTTSLGGESRAANERPGAGGIEGESGTT